MYRRILIGYDGGDQSRDAITLGQKLAEQTGAELVVAGVFQFDPVWGGFDSRFHEAEADWKRQIDAAAESAGAAAKSISSSSAARGLHDLAVQSEADLILVGSASHGRVGQTLAGSTGVALLHGSPCSVGIAPHGYSDHAEEAIETIVVAFDGSLESDHALDAACRLASKLGAGLKLVTVAEPPVIGLGKGGNVGWHDLKEAVEATMRERLTEAEATVPAGVDVDATFITGGATETLLSVAADAPGALLVVGSRGYGPLRRVLLGSVSTALVRSAPCPLIVTPRGMHDTSETTSRPETAAAP
jgi:nucleotide-binding universal stress UspA family protein